MAHCTSRYRPWLSHCVSEPDRGQSHAINKGLARSSGQIVTFTGSDDLYLRMLAAKQDQNAINDYVAWTIAASQGIGIKVVNAGGISAFKFNQRFLDLDEQNSY